MNLSAWLSHREAFLGFDSHEALADEAGIRADVVHAIAARGDLQKVSRSARAYLAKMLEVTVRDLESLAAGKTNWIPDTRRVDWTRVTPDCLRISRRQPSLGVVELVRSAVARGIIVVGRIGPGGIAHFLDDNANNEGRRLPVRVPGVPDAFALEATIRLAICPRGASLIFRGLPPGELREGVPALLTFGDAGETVFRQVRHKREQSLVVHVEEAGEDLILPLETIVRAAGVIGTYVDDGLP